MSNERFKDENIINTARNNALSMLDSDDDCNLDKIEEELVINSIKNNMDENFNIDINILKQEFLEANFIPNDKNNKLILKDFENVITFLIANGTLEKVSLGSDIMHVNNFQLKRILSYIVEKERIYKKTLK